MNEAIDPKVSEEIQRRLSAAEKEHDVTVLFAIESGSRAWGFASPDSDYDARFVYVHRLDWYLSLEPGRDVIEYPIVDEIDINGWDLRKALRLLGDSNPTMIEWLNSPIVYRDDGEFAPAARAALGDVFDVKRAIHHYVGTAKGSAAKYLQGDTVRLKKYFYALRPLLAAAWVEQFGTPPPIEFEKLRAVEPRRREFSLAVDLLLEKKRASVEKAMDPRIPELDEFITSELARFATLDFPGRQPDTSALEATFRKLVTGQSPGGSLPPEFFASPKPSTQTP